MPKWKNFAEYVQWREEQVHNMSHEEALKWVLSALDIMDNPDPKDQKQRDQINDALSSPLSAYPDKIDALTSQLQLKQSSNWPEIQAALSAPKKTTVSKLISIISRNASPPKTISDAPHQVDSNDDDRADGGQPFQKTYGNLV
jgi:hypothetical protein